MTVPATFHIGASALLITCCLAGNGAPGADTSLNTTDARAPQAEWLHGHGTDRGEHVFEGLQTRDGGFIAIGKTGESTRRGTNVLIVKTDGKGKLQWQRVIGDKGEYEEGRCIMEVADGYIAGGVLTQSGETKAGLLKLDSKGRTVWMKIYPHAGHGAIRGIDVATDGGIVATGYTDSRNRSVPFIADEAKGFTLRTDANGKLIWKKPLRVAQGTKIRADKQNGGFIICSTVWRSTKGKDHQDACLIKTDDKGTVMWMKNYGGPGDDQCFDMDLTADGYVLGGHTTSYGRGGWNAWLVRIDSKGKLMWHKSFGEPLGGDPGKIFDECYGVKTTPDGGFVMACGSGIEPDNTKGKQDPRNTWAAYIIRTDAAGKLLWRYTHHAPNKGHNAAEYVNLCRDGGYIVFLDSDTEGRMREENIGFLKLAAEK